MRLTSWRDAFGVRVAVLSRRSATFFRYFALSAAGLLTAISAHAQLAVSDGGSANYSYPIAVPPGIAGMAPKVSLSYSGGGNGIAGVGWSIGGISVISRCAAIRAIDGIVAPVKYTANDKLCLDGQRLIPTQADGTSPVTGANTGDAGGGSGMVREYRTENDSYARIRAYGGSAISGPGYFKVWTKSGQVYEYGINSNATSNAYVTLQPVNTSSQLQWVIAVWALSRVSDASGNYIDYQYDQPVTAWGSANASGAISGKEWSLREIRYTGNGAQAPANKVVFDYVNRPDTPGAAQDRAEGYYLGSKSVSIRRLSSIRTFVNSPNPGSLGPAAGAVLARTYTLNYDTGPNTGRSRLTQISDCAGASANQCLPTTFAYSAGGNEVYTANGTYSSLPIAKQNMQSVIGKYGILTGDFLGSGRTDILRWSDTPTENELFRSDGNGSFTQVADIAHGGTFNIIDQNLFKSDGCYSSFAVDFNGDGLTDILRYSNAGNAGGQACASYGSNYLYLNRGNGSFQQVAITIPLNRLIGDMTCGNYGCNQTAGSTFYILDLNGDGILDIVTTIIPSNNSGPAPVSCSSMVCTHVYFGQSNGSFVEQATNVTHISLYSAPKGAYVLNAPKETPDANGDGLADIVASGIPSIEGPYVGSGNAIWLSQGDGNFVSVPIGTYTTDCSNPINFNGDGRNDCIATSPSGASANALTLATGDGAMSNATNFNLTQTGTTAATDDQLADNASTPAGFTVADVNADGRDDIIRWKTAVGFNEVFLSNGDGTFRPSNSFNLMSSTIKRHDGRVDFITGNFTGNGDVELLVLTDNTSGTNNPPPPPSFSSPVSTLYVKSDPTPPDMLLSVTSPTGAVTSLTYVPLSNSVKGAQGARYVSDRGGVNAAAYPQADVDSSSYVVATVTSDNGIGNGTIATEYRYAGLKTGLDGRGMLGFREVRRQAPAPDPNGTAITSVTQKLQTAPFIGDASNAATYVGDLTVDTSAATPLATTSYSWCDLTAPAGSSGIAACTTSAKVKRPYLQSVSSTGHDLLGAALPTVTTANSNFTASGDPQTITTTTTGTALGLTQTFTKTVTNQFYADNTAGDNWWIGKLQKSTVNSVVPNSLPSIPTSAGTAANATATQGTTVPLNVTINPASINVLQSASGSFSASATVTATGTSQALTYSWARVAGSTSQITVAGTANPTFSATLALNQNITETFRVTVSDAAGDSGVADIAVTFRYVPPLAVSVSPSSLTVNADTTGTASGVATGSPSGGVAPYTYSWTRTAGTRSTVSSSTVANPTVSATLGWNENFTDTWQVTVTDAASNTTTASVNVHFTTPAQPAVTVSPSSLTINRNSPGTASGAGTASTTGGVGPYTYSWARTAGTRSTVSSSTVANPTFSASVSWNENFTDTWQVTSTDAAGNTATASVNVKFTTPVQPTVTISPSSLAVSAGTTGTASGVVTASPTGGVGPYTYSWTRSAGTRSTASSTTVVNPTISATLGWGENFTDTWQVTVTDAAGNAATASVNVHFTTAAQPVVTISPSSLTINRNSPGTASGAGAASAAGGVAPYTYSWTRTAGTRSTISSSTVANPTISATLGWGEDFTDTWQVTVTDAASNTATASVNVHFTTAAQPVVTVSPGSLTINRNSPGTASGAGAANATGGVAPYTYSWTRTAGTRSSVSSSTAANPTFSASVSWNENFTDTWQVTSTDAAGNTATASVNVKFTTPVQPVVSVSPSSLTVNAGTTGTASGVVAGSASGGVAPYTYSWTRTAGTRSTASSTTVANPTISATLGWNENFTDTWQVTVTDAASNTATASVNVHFTTAAQPAVTISPGSLTINRNSPGTASGAGAASVTGGVAPYTYSWTRTAGIRSSVSSSTAANPTFSASVSWNENFTDTWQVTATDAAGNTATASVNVKFTTPVQPTVAISPSSLAVSAGTTGTASGVVTGSASGGVAPYTYSWTRTAGTRSSVSSSTVANPTISATLGWGENFTDTWQVIVTDAAGNMATASVNVHFTSPSAPTNTLPWANGSTQSFCYGMYPILSHTYSFTVGGAPQKVTLSPLSNSYWNITTTGWTNGATLSAGTYQFTLNIVGSYWITVQAPLGITFAGTGQTSNTNVVISAKRECQ